MLGLLLWSLRILLLILIYSFIARFLKLIIKDISSFNKKGYQENTSPRIADNLEEASAFLVLDKGDTKNLKVGESFLLKKTLTIGRDETNEIIIDIPYVSSTHAKVSREDDRYFVSDLESRNGTYLNGKIIQAKTSLKNGDLIQIGNVLLRFEEGRV